MGTRRHGKSFAQLILDDPYKPRKALKDFYAKYPVAKTYYETFIKKGRT